MTFSSIWFMPRQTGAKSIIDMGMLKSDIKGAARRGFSGFDIGPSLG